MALGGRNYHVVVNIGEGVGVIDVNAMLESVFKENFVEALVTALSAHMIDR